MPDYCDGCGSALSIYHSLDCKKGSLVMARHNELCDGVADITDKVFTPMHMHENPKMFTGCAMHGGKAKAKGKGAPPQYKTG